MMAAKSALEAEEVTSFKMTSDAENDGKATITLKFDLPVSLTWITFRNSYSAALSIRCCCGVNKDWKIALDDYTLMPAPHFADGCNDPFAVSIDDLSDTAAFSSVIEMQLTARQPSPHWYTFGLLDVRCFSPCKGSAPPTHTPTSTPTPTSTTSLNTPHQSKVPDQLEALVSQLNTMQSITGSVAHMISDVGFDRFEVDDSYNIESLNMPPKP
eukprot:m.264464 g.264464  ORF g.264464 m.264464 type:complete len:213 (-) comp56305_c0_seq1:9-647(-)